MHYAPIELATIKITGEHVLVSHVQSMENTVASLILEYLAIPYWENQHIDPDLWNDIFAQILIFRVDQYIKDDAQNIIYSLYKIASFIKQQPLGNKTISPISEFRFTV